MLLLVAAALSFLWQWKKQKISGSLISLFVFESCLQAKGNWLASHLLFGLLLPAAARPTEQVHRQTHGSTSHLSQSEHSFSGSIGWSGDILLACQSKGTHCFAYKGGASHAATLFLSLRLWAERPSGLIGRPAPQGRFQDGRRQVAGVRFTSSFILRACVHLCVPRFSDFFVWKSKIVKCKKRSLFKALSLQKVFFIKY